MTGPLDGVRILDLTRLLPGGVLTALLGDLGADVIKVEEPTKGDYMRWEQPRIGTESAASWIVGRNKRSIALDLKDPRGVDAFLRLAATADVVIEGVRPGVVDRLGVGFDAVRARNPRIVYASLTGWGSDGPMRDVAGHDINYIAYAGVLGMTGPPGGPVCPPGVQVGDLGGATMLAIGLLAALYKAEKTGEGERVEVALYDAALAWTSIHAGELWASGHVPNPGEMLLNGRYPCYGVYRCSDGRHISVGAIEPKFWQEFCTILGRDDLLDRRLDPDARSAVAQAVAQHTRDEWAQRFDGTDACVAPVLDLAEALAHPLARQRRMVLDAPHDDIGTAPTLGTPIRIGGAAQPPGRPPSRLGEDSVQLLEEIGVDPGAVAQLVADGVVRDGR